MRAYKYELKVSEGALALTHGIMREIDEIYIPEKHIVFNIGDGLNVFFKDEPRNKDYTKIEIDELLADRLEQFIRIRQNLEQEVERIFSKGKSR